MASIYVGTYAKYNNGSLFGKWLDLGDYSDYDELITAMYELHFDEQDRMSDSGKTRTIERVSYIKRYIQFTGTNQLFRA
ncbi:antirestriction protein ArdA [Chryseobacterium arthrosphaerae]|uniref:antirestriction protein ArdA n=1 Tax=Chryseobacterium arthrosphaerae TaxID=651561 RepID=UPI00293F14F9|nr:antirestriction protein ArdA [Chryseobacterium arthrosphaerae]